MKNLVFALTLLFQQSLLSTPTEQHLETIKGWLPKKDDLNNSKHTFFSLLKTQDNIKKIYLYIKNQIRTAQNDILIAIPEYTECKNNSDLLKQLITMYKALIAISIAQNSDPQALSIERLEAEIQDLQHHNKEKKLQEIKCAQATKNTNAAIFTKITLEEMKIDNEFLDTFQILQKQETNSINQKDETDKNKTIKQISTVALTAIACGMLLYFVSIKEKNQLKEDEHHYYRIKVKTNLNQN